MTGFQTFLCVIAGIVAFFIIILSVPIKITIGYDDKIRLTVKYLFIKLNILPVSPKKKKAEKPPKEKKPKEDKPKKEKPPKEKKPNPILEMVKANGYDGMMTVIKNLGAVLGKYGGKLFKSVKFYRLDLHISVGTGDSAATAIKYGETCQKVFPVMGFICSNNYVKQYDINVEPDFLANKTEGEFYCDMGINLRKIINASIAMVFRLIIKVVVKFIVGGTKKEKDAENGSDKVTKPNS